MEFNENDSEVTFYASLSLHENFRRIISIVCIIIAATVGNVTLIAVIVCKRHCRVKRVEIILVNLAIGDLMVAMVTMTTEIIFIAYGEWVLGMAMCKISVYLQLVTLASTSFLMTVMGIDRYQMIVKPFESLSSRPKIRMKVITAWVMAFIFAMPQLLIFVRVKTTKPDGSTRLKCVSKGYTNEWQRKAYFTFVTSYILVIPGAIMLYCYSNITRVVFSRAKDILQIHHNNASVNTNRISIKQSLLSTSKRRVLTMALTVSVGFFTCLTPYFIINLVRIYSNYTIRWDAALYVVKVMYMSHSALNPIIYGILSLRIEHLYNVFNTCFHQVPVDNVSEKSTSYNSQQ